MGVNLDKKRFPGVTTPNTGGSGEGLTPQQEANLNKIPSISNSVNTLNTKSGKALYFGESIVGSVEVENNILGKVDEIKNTVIPNLESQLENKLNKTDTINSSQLAIDTNANKIKLVNLADEVQQAMTGNAPALSVIPNKSITLEKIGFVTTGKNLFNKNTLTLNKMLSGTNIIDTTDYSLSDYIEIDANTQYICNFLYGYAYYDANKTVISGHYPSSGAGSSVSITTLANAKYIRLNCYKTRYDTMQFEKGTTSTTYEEYYAKIPENYLLLPINQYKNSYPFYRNSVMGYNDIDNSIIDIKLNNTLQGKIYVMSTIVNNGIVQQIYINQLSSVIEEPSISNLVTTFYRNTNLSNTIETINLSQYNSSGITGVIKIDWSKIQGVNYTNVLKTKYIIDNKCYSDERLTSREIQINTNTLSIANKLDKINFDNLVVSMENLKVDTIQKRLSKEPFSQTALTSTFSGWAFPFKKTSTFNKVRFGINIGDKTNENFIGVIMDSTNNIISQTSFILSKSGSVDVGFSFDFNSLPSEFYVGYYHSSKSIQVMHYTGVNTGEEYSTLKDKYITAGAWVEVSSGKRTPWIDLINTTYGSPVTTTKEYLSLPEKYELVVGDTFELFYKGVLLANNPYNYNFKITCAKGSAYSKRYVFTPTASDIGTHLMTITVIDDNDKVLDTKSVNLVVKAKATNPATVQNVLCVGDSLTSGGFWVSECCRRLTGTGGTPIADGLTNIKFVGTVSGTSGAKFEGYGGWQYNHYNTNMVETKQYWIQTTANKPTTYQKSIWKDSNNVNWVLETIEATRIKVYRNVYGSQLLPASGTLTWVSGGDGTSNTTINYTSYTEEAGNPFWDNTNNKVDFSVYATKIGVTSIDHCYVLLGWNSTSVSETTTKSNIRTFITNLRTSFPNCKITLLGLQVPSIDGFGANYGCSWNYMDKLKVVFNLNKWNLEVSKEFTNVDFINIAGQFDSENNIQLGTRQVNARNSKTESYGTNGVHPAIEGYLQIGDAVYRNLSHKI